MNQSDPSQNDEGQAKVIVLLPTEDDPINEIASGDVPHVTLAYFGDESTDIEEAKKLTKALADTGYAYPEPYDHIAGEGTLGEGGAQVYFLDARFSSKVRDLLVGDPWLQQEMARTDQFPTWTPHLTIGYPDAPPRGEGKRPEGIVYDRIALFADGEVHEYPFDFEEAEDGAENAMSLRASGEDQVEDEEHEEALKEVAKHEGEDFEIPIHGVLAPEGIASSDGRMFAPGAMKSRALPLPMRHTPADWGSHDGAVTVGRIDAIRRAKDGRIKFAGVLDSTDVAFDALMLLANGMLRGVSVDVGDSVGEQDGEGGMIFSSVKLAAATLVAIPAFEGAYVALGPWDEDEDLDESEEAEAPEEFAISEKEWDGSPGRFTNEEYHRACTVHLHEGGTPESKDQCKVPIKEPNGDLSRAGVHAAASRIDQTDAPEAEISKAKSQIKSAYKQLGEDAPEEFAAVEEFVGDKLLPKHMDGPGWITDPRPTKRITSYWVDGRGAAKINWGPPGDFNRCRRQLAKYVKNPKWLAGLCANLHHRATGTWPGQHNAVDGLVASASPSVTFTQQEGLPDGDWFEDPQLDGPTPFTVTPEGRVFGHLATWDVCHVGFGTDCRTAPPSKSEYAYFRTGEIETTTGPVAVGQIVSGGDHAGPKANMALAAKHYASTSAALADVTAGEDQYGIWVAGSIRHDAPSGEIKKLRASALSGDWRTVRNSSGANLELLAALAVNTPGFPIPRTRIAAANGRATSLVAAGIVPQRDRAMQLSVLREEFKADRLATLRATFNQVEGV